MKSHVSMQAARLLRVLLTGTLVWAFLCLGLPSAEAASKEASLIAIEIYDGPNGPAYLQLGDVLINGRAEMRSCAGCPETVDKSVYNKLEKLLLGPGGVLERGSDGALRYSLNGGATMVVAPATVKFEHNAAYTLSELGDLAVVTATPLAPSNEPSLAAPLKKGAKLVFLAAPDVELAEYLRAQRAGNISGWQGYLSKFPAATHSADAKTALAALFVHAGEAALKAYEQSAAGASPAYDDLKTAKAQSDQAHALTPQMPQLVQLEAGVRAALSAIAARGVEELAAYRSAFNAHQAGYIHLQAAQKDADLAAGIDSSLPAIQALQAEVLKDSTALQTALRSADEAKTAGQFDAALEFILPYRAFIGEEPRLAAVVDGAFDFHLSQAKQAETAPDWAGAIHEYELALKAKDSEAVRESLKNARAQLIVVQDRQAAAKALESSKAYEAEHDIVRAYEALSTLSAAQQRLVDDDIERLKPAYILGAAQLAKNLSQAHTPIRGIADEVGIENAYSYLQDAYQLSQNESYRDRMEVLGDQMSAYLLEQAKHYLGKPAGSGAELGWMYLSEAAIYKASNLDAVRDAMVSATAAHALRSKLSIRVQFRDQTSQRDSAGFAGQLENVIITGLEGAGIPMKVVRSSETTPVEPDFQLTGDVLQHHLSVAPLVEAKDSKYRAGEKEVPSEEWNQANRAYEKAEIELQTAQASLQGAEAKGNKKQIGELNNAVQAAQKNVEDAHVKLDATPKTVTTDVLRPYTYTRKTISLGGVIQLQFRIANSFSGEAAETVPVAEEAHKEFVVLENVKPEDTEGVKPSGVEPDTADFLTTLENAALKDLIGAVRAQVEKLPAKIYKQAHLQETEGDLDGAGEAYLRYLNIVPEDDSAERKHAKQFLQEQFNMAPAARSNP
jgi:hypothetical protein